MLFLAILITLCIPIVCQLFGVQRDISIAAWFFVIAQFIGIYARACVTDSGLDSFVGPSNPAWIRPALKEIMLYNVAFLAGILFWHIVRRPAIKQRMSLKTATHPEQEVPSNNGKFLVSLIVCSLPGIYMLLHHHTLLSGATAGTKIFDAGGYGKGPQIMISEIPYTALAVWYSIRKGNVGVKWWISTFILLGLSFLSGSRTQALTFIIVLIALELLQEGKRITLKTSFLFVITGFILLYVGSLVSYVRYMERVHGGSFMEWAASSLHTSPLNAFTSLLGTSFNGYDGLVSIIGTVPNDFSYHPGELWYQFATIIIPRSIWHAKWTYDIITQFTDAVWGWAPGSSANYVTGAGAFYLDSGTLGIFIGAFLLGVITVSICQYSMFNTNKKWFSKTLVSVWIMFLTMFTYEGSVSIFSQMERVVIEFFVILVVYKFILKLLEKSNVYSSPRDSVEHTK